MATKNSPRRSITKETVGLEPTYARATRVCLCQFVEEPLYIFSKSVNTLKVKLQQGWYLHLL